MGHRRVGMAGALVLAVLAGCGGRASAPNGADEPARGAARSTELVETDVEAPEVFQATAQGLWDGRPSLGGVWVAHPDAADPERVVIRNGDNGQFVIGALFRRERENPGPPIQVSSDAAEALGMLAGAPANLNVTALRREEAAAPEPTEATAPTPVEGLAEAVANDFPAPAPVETTALAPAADGAAVGAAAAAILGASADPAAADPAPASTPASALDRPFLQIGIFSQEGNARATADALSASGLPARVEASTTQGADFWRVLVGPAATEAERASFLERAVAQGFADAYAVRN